MGANDETKRAFAEWLASSPGLRRRLGLPESQKAWAERYEVTPRTLGRWKKDPQVQQWVDDAKDRRREAPAPESQELVAAQAEAEGDPTAREFAEIRAALIEEAKGGDRGALELYMKHVGSGFIEQERKARESGLRELSDEELLDELVELAGESLRGRLDV